mgnify:FL=1
MVPAPIVAAMRFKIEELIEPGTRRNELYCSLINLSPFLVMRSLLVLLYYYPFLWLSLSSIEQERTVRGDSSSLSLELGISQLV